MEFPVKTGAPARQRTECAILPVFDDGQAARRDEGLRSSRTRRHREAHPRRATHLLVSARCTMVHRTQGTAAARWLLVGCGKHADFSAKRLTTALGAAIHALRTGGTKEATSFLGYDVAARARRRRASQRRDGALEPLPLRRAQEPQRSAVAARASRARVRKTARTRAKSAPESKSATPSPRAATSRATSAIVRPTSARRRTSPRRRATSPSATSAWK